MIVFLFLGKTPFLVKLLEAALKSSLCRDLCRFKQARYLISVTAELMKPVNQHTITFQKLRDVYLLTKAIYLGLMISMSELREIMQRGPRTSESMKHFPILSDRITKMKVDLPNGSDPELPDELPSTYEQRQGLYKIIMQFSYILDTSSIPEVRKIYEEMKRVTINYYPVNFTIPPPLILGPMHGGNIHGKQTKIIRRPKPTLNETGQTRPEY